MEDVARACGVSPATVDRVLNRRKGVTTRMRDRVLRAAGEVGYLDAAAVGRLIAPPPPKIAFLLPSGGNAYLRLLAEKVKLVAATTMRNEATIRCFFIESFDAAALAGALRKQAGWADGVAFMAIDHPLVREAAQEAQARGVRLVTIVSDLSHATRAAYVGLDNRVAGRTAAYLISRFCKSGQGAVALVAGSRNYRTHAEREAGFLGLIEESLPGLRVIGMREGHDDRNENYRHTLDLIRRNRDLVGIYNVGGASDGIGRALRETAQAGRIVFIGHGLTADTRALLIEGVMDAVINSSPDEIIARALAHFTGRAEGQGSGVAALPVAMEIVFRENIPPAT